MTTLYVTHDQVEAMTLGQRVAVLNHGVVQQVDAPDVLYNRPDNTFVASFIGSPAMNFLRARSDGRTLSFGGYSLPLPDAVAARPSRRDGEMIVGLRPEHFSDARLGAEAPSSRSTVEITEQLGSETLVYFRVDGVNAELNSGDVGGRSSAARSSRGSTPARVPLPGDGCSSRSTSSAPTSSTLPAERR